MTLITAYIDKKSKMGYMAADLNTVYDNFFAVPNHVSKIKRIKMLNGNALIAGSGIHSIVHNTYKSLESSNDVTYDTIAQVLHNLYIEYKETESISGGVELVVLTDNGELVYVNHDNSIVKPICNYAASGCAEKIAIGTLGYFNDYMQDSQFANSVKLHFKRTYELANKWMPVVSKEFNFETMELNI